MRTPVDICIITQLHLSSNPRVVKEADALAAAGYDVSVIAPDYSEWGREADREFEGRPWRIVERPQFGPLSPPMTRVAELMRRTVADGAVRFLRSNDLNFLHAALSPVAPLLVAAAKRQPAALYIGHLAGLPAAAIAAGYHGTKYAYDAEDFHPGDLPNSPEHAISNHVVRAIERRYLPGCDYMTAASPGIASCYAAEYDIPLPTVILNTFPATNAPPGSSPAGWARPGPSVYWFSQTIGRDRGLQTAIEAIALSSCGPHLYLRGACTDEFVEELQRIAREYGVDERLHILPIASPNRMEELAAAYDVGFCGETGHTLNRRVALTNKQFTYLLAGVPVIMSSIPSHLNFAAEAGGAVELFEAENASSLAQALDRVLGDPVRLAAMRARAWELGQTRFNWDTDSKRLVEIVRRTVRASYGTPTATSIVGKMI